MLPRSFGWEPPFRGNGARTSGGAHAGGFAYVDDGAGGGGGGGGGAGLPPPAFPRLARWYAALCEQDEFARCRREILDVWVAKEAEGQFTSIVEDVANHPEFKWKF
jgi:hypothetical protein